MTECISDDCRNGWLLHSWENGELYATDIPCSKCRPDDYKTWSDIKAIERKLSEVEWAVAALKTDLERATFKYKIKKVIRETDWTLKGLRKKIIDKTLIFRVRQRRHFYRVHLHSAKWDFPQYPGSGFLRVVFGCRPNWIGQKIFGYPFWKEGYYGSPSEWRRMCSMNQAEIPSFMKKDLDIIYKKMRLGQIVGRS